MGGGGGVGGARRGKGGGRRREGVKQGTCRGRGGGGPFRPVLGTWTMQTYPKRRDIS
jgi:hypothetical protein